MIKKPIIGIISRSYNHDGKSVIEINEEYRLAVVKGGGIPFIVVPSDNTNYGAISCPNSDNLNNSNIESLDKILSFCDGILMPGGYVWNKFDEYICQYALTRNIPILGICLGMQIMGSIEYFNTSVHDRTIKNNTVINHCQEEKEYVHRCKLNEGPLKEILKKDYIMVNSRHNYHIISRDYFHIDAYSEDGLIEAISIPNHKFAIGVQWHPESMLEYDDDMLKIFVSFIKAAEKQ